MGRFSRMTPCRNPNACGVINHRKGSAEEKACEQRIRGIGRDIDARKQGQTQRVAAQLPRTVQKRTDEMKTDKHFRVEKPEMKPQNHYRLPKYKG